MRRSRDDIGLNWWAGRFRARAARRRALKASTPPAASARYSPQSNRTRSCIRGSRRSQRCAICSSASRSSALFSSKNPHRRREMSRPLPSRRAPLPRGRGDFVFQGEIHLAHGELEKSLNSFGAAIAIEAGLRLGAVAVPPCRLRAVLVRRSFLLLLEFAPRGQRLRPVQIPLLRHAD